MLPVRVTNEQLQGTGWQATALGCLVAAILLLTMSGHPYARDEETLFATTETLARYGSFALAPDIPLVDTTASPNGGFYSPYGPLKPLLQLPLYWLGERLASAYPPAYQPYILRLVVSVFNVLVQAAITSLLCLLIVRLGYRWRTATFISLLATFATFAWPHSRTGFAEPLSTLFLLLAVYLLTPRQGRGKLPFAFGLAGACLSLALATKFQNLIAIPAIGLYALWAASPRQPGQALARPSLQALLTSKATVYRLVAFAAALVLAYLPLGLYNQRAFGGFFTSGYGDAKGIILVTPFLEGLYDLLLSPGKGYLWFAPPVILLLFSLRLAWREQQAMLLLCLGLLVTHLLFYANNRFWHGDGSWGPRYLIPVIPFTLVPVAALVERIWQPHPQPMQKRRLNTLAKAGVLALAVLGVVGQVFGAAVNFDTYINQTYADFGSTQAGDQYRYFTLAGSPLVGHARLLATRLAEWPPPAPESVTLTEGWSGSEGAKGASLPRWTTGNGVAHVGYSGDHYTLTIKLVDHRPPSLPRANVVVLLDGKRRGALVKQAAELTYTCYCSGNLNEVSINSETWNPQDSGIERDERLGISVEQISFIDGNGRSYQVTSGPNLPALPTHSPLQRFNWFYRTDYPHLLDHWFWYAQHSGLSPGEVRSLTTTGLGTTGLLGLVGVACLGLARRKLKLRLNND